MELCLENVTVLHFTHCLKLITPVLAMPESLSVKQHHTGCRLDFVYTEGSSTTHL